MKLKPILRMFKQGFLFLFGRSYLQPFWEKAFKLSLIAMNIGGGSSFSQSGEKQALEFIRKRLVEFKLKDPWVIFDVGANVGGYSKMVIQALKPAGHPFKIYAFEPARETFNVLQSSLSNSSEVILNSYALGENSGTAELYSDSALSGLASFYNRDLAYIDSALDSRETVKIKRLDEFCLENSIEQIDFLKMDVEGHELAVLTGAGKMLTNKKIRFLQFEFGGANIDSRSYFKDFYYLLSPNYKIYRILRSGLYEIKNYKEIYEVFITTNFLAELKR